MADLKDLVIVFFVGLAVGYILKSSTSAHYSNIEEWEFIRDETGRTRGVRVHRKAEET